MVKNKKGNVMREKKEKKVRNNREKVIHTIQIHIETYKYVYIKIYRNMEIYV
jgi:hypothetical protein